MVVIADEIAVGIARPHLPEDPFLAGFENARGRDPDGRRGRGRGTRVGSLELAEGGDGVAVVLGIFELAVDRAGAGRPGGRELVEIANDGNDLWFGLECSRPR